MKHPNRGILLALLFSFVLALGGSSAAFAGTLTLGYAGAGVYANCASANSERYFRAIAVPASSEWLASLTLSCPAGGYTLYPGVGTDEGVCQSGYTHTIGPFAGYDIWGNPHQGVIGNLPTPGWDEGESRLSFTFTAVFCTSSACSTVRVSGSVCTVSDNQDYLQWFSGDATGVDPLGVFPAEIAPDDGTGSSRFRFMVRYARRNSSSNLRPRFGTRVPPPGSAPGHNCFVEYNYDTGLLERHSDRGIDGWGYGPYDDWHSLDRIGWDQNWEQQDPHVVLIIDGDRSRPRFMYKLNPSDNNYDDGMIYYYDLMPTDYKRYLENIFMFPYDPAGEHELGRSLDYLRGRPMSNNYVALAAGGHIYEFLASDDFSPCNGNNNWLQVGRPGDGAYNDYQRVRPFRVNFDRREISSIEVSRENTLYDDSDGAAGGSGYPYDSQDPTRFPKVDPVLSAHPYFPSGTIEPDSDFYPDPVDASGVIVTSPFPAETGAGPNPPMRYTNDDTILPNYVNIHPETAATPFKGGKWTNQSTFTFRINYWQSENIAPALIRIFIRRNDDGQNPGAPWTAYTMEQMDPLDTSYDLVGNGCVFQFQATPEQLPGGGGPGDYNYYFAANDGTMTTTYPNRPPVYNQPNGYNIYDPGHDGFVTTIGQYGVPTVTEANEAEGEDYYWFRVNRPPTLGGQSVDPAVGRAGENYHFRVDYADINGEVLNPDATGDRPFHTKIHLDLFGSPLLQASIAQVTGVNLLTYVTGSGDLYDDGTLSDVEVPFSITMQTGAAAGNTYAVAGNTGNTITLAAGTNLSTDGVASGDQFRIEQWFEGTMLAGDVTDTDYSDGAEYVFDTATNVELGPGVHRYWFEFTDDCATWLSPDDPNVKAEGETVRHPTAGYFEGPEVRENSAPELEDFRFTPQSTDPDAPDGTTATSFVFFVTYVDHENDPPTLIRLGIDGTAGNPEMVLDLVADPPEDTVYTDGAMFRTPEVKLSEGDHVFYAQASDGKARFPETDPGDPLIFSGPIVPQPAPDPLDPPDGNDDGYYDFAYGPTVADNTPPTLNFLPEDDGTDPDNPPGLDPNSGRRETTFTYTVVYTDTDRFAGIAGNPPQYVRVYIDDVRHDMTKIDPNDYDYTDGATFEFSISNLIEGTPHTYFFLASDDLDRARLPTTGITPDRYNGPVVDEPPGEPLNLLVQDTPNDNGGSTDIEFSASRDDGGGADDVTEYRVYRTQTQGQYSDTPVVTVAATGAAAYNAQDTAPASTNPPVTDVAYYYIVKAFDAATESDRSNEEGPVTPKDNIPPQPPSGVAVSNPALGATLDVSWTLSPDDGAGQNDVTEYHIYRATTPALLAAPYVGTALADESSFRDTTAPDGVAVYYMLRAYDGSNESEDSNVAGPETSTDGEAPVVIDLQPGAGETGVRRDTTISFVVEDNGSGVDQGSIQVDVTISGAAVPGSIEIGGTTKRMTVEFTPDAEFDYLRNVRVEVNVRDLQNNPRIKSWSFVVEGEPTSIISGQVLQADDSPIAGVRIVAGELEGVTGADGSYTITGVADGTHEVRTELRGWYFTPQQMAVSVPPDQGGINFIGQLGYDIDGQVVDENGVGKSGALISAGGKSQVTGADGTFQLRDLPAGTYNIAPVLEGFDFVPPLADIEIGPGLSPDPLEFMAVVESHSLSGIIQTSTGDRMATVAVTARNADTGASTEVLSSASGLYVFQQLRQGTYEVTPAKSDYQFKPLKQSVELMTQRTDVNFIGVPLYEVVLPAGLSLVAVPISPETTDFRAAFGANTPVARWDSANEEWITNATPEHPLLELGAGRGYWTNPAAEVTNYVAGTPISTGVGHDLQLAADWTMVGNPYPADLPWSRIGVAPGGTVKDYGFIWDRNADPPDYRVVADVNGFGILDRVPEGAGFWMNSSTARTVRINPLTAPTAVETAPLVLADGDYVIPLQAAAGGRADTCAAAGVVKAAERLPGGGRLVNPPPAGSHVDLYFIGPDGGKLCYDLRASADATESWDFEVVTDIGDVAVAISLLDLSRVPADKQVTLEDTASGKRTYARTTQQYTYQATGGQARRFKLEIGPRSVGSLAISAASAAMSRGGQVALTYTLSQTANVSISVMNISGRQIKYLVADKPASSGVNTELWDLTSTRGTTVPAGRYLISIVATTDSGQQTRALVPVQVSR